MSEHNEKALPAEIQPELLPAVQSSTYSFNLPDGDSPTEIRARVKVLKHVTERCYMRLAHDLWKCYHRQLYIGFGYNTFDDYVADEVGISRDRSHKLRRIYEVLHLKCQIPTREIEEAERGRVELILSVVDRTNAREWLDRAKSLPYKSLQNELATVRSRRAADRDPTPTEPITAMPSTPVRIAGDSPRADKPVSAQKFVKRAFRLPEDGDSLLSEALGVARRITKSHSDTFNLICIAQQFLAHNLTLEGKNDPRKDYWLRWMEEIYGGHFIHVKDEAAWEVLRQAVEDPANEHLLSSVKRREHVRDECDQGPEHVCNAGPAGQAPPQVSREEADASPDMLQAGPGLGD